MKNQTPHTPQTQTPSSADKKGIIAMKAPKFPTELLKRFEQTKAMKFSKKTIKEVNELLIQTELKKQQNQIPDYTEVAGLKVLTQDLDKPQSPKVKLLKKGQKHQKYCCWELKYKGQIYYQYDFHGAIKEAEFRGIKVLSDKDWTKLEEELGEKGLIESLGLKEKEDFKGFCSGGIRNNCGDNISYWSSSVYTPSSTCSRRSRRRDIAYSNASVDRYNDVQDYGFSVRCCFKN